MTEEDGKALLALFEKHTNKRSRTYELRAVGHRLMFVRKEFERIVEHAIDEALGSEPEPDDRDGTFLE